MSRHMASGMPCAPGWDEPLEARISLLDPAWMVERQELGDDAAHRMAADDRLLDLEMVQDRRGVVGEHLDRVFLNIFARLARAAIVE